MSDREAHLRDRDGGRVPGPSVVVADDDQSARVLIGNYLAKMQLCNPVRLAEDGHRAIEVLESEEDVPALVLLDVKMPGRSGLEVLAWIREDPRLAAVPVVMLTGSSELDEVDQAHALGISSYLVKPVGFAAMQEVLARLEIPWMLLTPKDGA